MDTSIPAPRPSGTTRTYAGWTEQVKCSKERHYLCQIASTESRRPVGLFTNLAWVKSQMVPGWPRLSQSGSTASLLRPDLFPGRCSCTTPHAPMKGTDGQEMFNSSISAGFSKQFWFSCTASSFAYEGHVPLWVGGPSHTCPSPSMSLSSCVSPLSFSGWSGSAFSGYDVWARGSLSRSFLTDYAGASSAAVFFWFLDLWRLFSILQRHLLRHAFRRCAAVWYEPGYGAVKFSFTVLLELRKVPGDLVAEGRWRDAWQWWLRRTKLGLPSEVVDSLVVLLEVVSLLQKLRTRQVVGICQGKGQQVSWWKHGERLGDEVCNAVLVLPMVRDVARWWSSSLTCPWRLPRLRAFRLCPLFLLRDATSVLVLAR